MRANTETSRSSARARAATTMSISNEKVFKSKYLLIIRRKGGRLLLFRCWKVAMHGILSRYLENNTGNSGKYQYCQIQKILQIRLPNPRPDPETGPLRPDLLVNKNALPGKQKTPLNVLVELISKEKVFKSKYLLIIRRNASWLHLFLCWRVALRWILSRYPKNNTGSCSKYHDCQIQRSSVTQITCQMKI